MHSRLPISRRIAQTHQDLVIIQGHYMLLCISHAQNKIELLVTRDKNMKHLLGAF